MRDFLDTNILISSILGQGTPFRAYVKAVSFPNTVVICQQNIDEMRRIFNRKFPKRIATMEKFLIIALNVVEVAPMVETPSEVELLVRDPVDRPILRAAIHAGVDVLVIGDKDFLEAGIKHPLIMNAADFVNMQK